MRFIILFHISLFLYQRNSKTKKTNTTLYVNTRVNSPLNTQLNKSLSLFIFFLWLSLILTREVLINQQQQPQRNMLYIFSWSDCRLQTIFFYIFFSIFV